MVRLVRSTHVGGERADDPRHPPLQTDYAAIIPALSKGCIVFQYAVGEILGRGRPDLANDREMHLNYWPPPIAVPRAWRRDCGNTPGSRSQGPSTALPI